MCVQEGHDLLTGTQFLLPGLFLVVTTFAANRACANLWPPFAHTLRLQIGGTLFLLPIFVFIDQNVCVESDIRQFLAPFWAYASSLMRPQRR